uniref:Uncharacterized protein n=1 Tax=Plectus sambesii TaxID=2011161 RepID=A0A914VES9_9BILA
MRGAQCDSADSAADRPSLRVDQLRPVCSRRGAGAGVPPPGGRAVLASVLSAPGSSSPLTATSASSRVAQVASRVWRSSVLGLIFARRSSLAVVALAGR